MIDRYSRPEMKQVWSEDNKYGKWLQVELAACEAWAEDDIVPKDDMNSLRGATYNLDRLNEILKETRHEMTAFLSSITEFIGPEGRWLHLGLTTSDVWDTATSLQLVEAVDLLDREISNLMVNLSSRAKEHKNTLMMGRTHGIHAEPITFGLKMALWWDEMRRHRERLAAARKSIAVGKLSGPVGTYATVPPSVETRVCQKLGLESAPISNQVLQRDRHAHFVTTLGLIASSLEKFATEIRGLQRTEISELAEPFPEGQPGSSSMPHKRNPELSERVCGLARLVRGHSLTAMENVALWGERDISHSSAERIIFPDACIVLDYMLNLFSDVIQGMKVYPERMQQNLESTGNIFFSQKVLLALIEKGLSRETAYSIVHKCSMKSWNDGHDFRDLIKADTNVTTNLSSHDLDAIFDKSHYVRYVDDIFARLDLEGVARENTS